jgi:hypothetical protein
MALKSLTPNGPNGQTQAESPATSLTIQQRYNLALRLLRDNDSRLEMVIRERDALLAERVTLQAEVEAAALCYRDVKDAGRLSEQGKAAVEEAWDIICQGMTY